MHISLHVVYTSIAVYMYRLEEWGMGTKRSYSEYLKMVGIDMNNKVYYYIVYYVIYCIL